MSKETGIAWASHTASPWFGCSKVSAGCTNCYAEELTLRNKWAGWGDNSPRVRSKGFWKDAYKWNLLAELATGLERPRMFTSLMDWLDPQVPIEWLADFLKVIHDCQNLDWLLLTKRPEQFFLRATEAIGCDLRLEKHGKVFNDWLTRWANGHAPSNVWFGVTVENQAMADKRIPELLKIPARVRWLSVEPLLGPVNLRQYFAHSIFCEELPGPGMNGGQPCACPKIHWVVVGGESGKNRRDPDLGVASIVEVAQQCNAAKVPVFVKQDCALKPGQKGRIPDDVWSLKQYPKL